MRGSRGCMVKTHGMTRSPFYCVWQKLKERHKGSVCNEWMASFDVFLKEMGPSYKPNHMLVRIDKKGDYSQANCMWKNRDLTGSSFGKLTVIGKAGPSRSGKSRWVCRCACGNMLIVFQCNLIRSHTTSCGCENHKAGKASHRFIHGESHARTHNIWLIMRDRCANPKNRKYANYGGRGITVCPQWGSFLVFLKDMGHAPDGMSIDRIDNDGPYSPENCRWATALEQANNRRVTLRATHNGETKTLTEWSRATGIPYKRIWSKLRSGLSFEQVLAESPLDAHSPYQREEAVRKCTA